MPGAPTELGILPYDLTRPHIWQDTFFQELILTGIRREGFPEKTLETIQTIFREESPQTYQAMKLHLERKAPGPDSRQLIAHLDKIYDGNQDCYACNSMEETRVTQWPNPITQKENSAHYVDIYEDAFYRNAPRFITKSTPIGSFGSCFARHIAHQLQAWEYNYIIEEDDLPPGFPIDQLYYSNYRTAPARVGTLLHAGAIRQTVQRAFGLWHPDKFIIRDGAKFRDPFRYIETAYDSLDKYYEDYERHTAALRRALLKCKVLILTLGLTEAWQFAHSGDYISMAPQAIDPLLVRQKNLTVEDNIREIETLLSIYRQHVPSVKLILSVSPVGLNRTYSRKNHVVAATCYSKSVLRVAAEELTNRHPDGIFYFPAFETVMYGCPHPWKEDHRHVSEEAVARVMNLFQKMFLV